MIDTRFYFRAVGIALHENHVLLHRAEDEDFWSLPGGSVEPGEFAPQTLAREMREELEADVTVGALRFVIENHFIYKGKHYQEFGLYFEMAFAPDSLLLDKVKHHTGVERFFHAADLKLIFEWVPLADLASRDLRPNPLISLLAGPLDGIRHILNRDTVALPTRSTE